MPESILVPLSLSLDSLIVSMAIVMLGMPSARALRLGAAFMIFDGLATLTGLSLHGGLAPLLLCAYLALLLAVAARSPWRNALWAPALFSLDNLFVAMAAKPGVGNGIWVDSVTAALTSGLLALAGIAIATAVVRNAPRRYGYRLGLILLVTAICL